MDPLSERIGIQAVKDESKRQKIEEILTPLQLNMDTIKWIKNTFEQHAQNGASKDKNLQKKSSLLMDNTYVTNLLKGNENGDFLGLDLGGTNFRVVLARFTNGTAKTTTKYYNLTEDLLTGPAEGVFLHIASSMHKFITDQKIQSESPVPVGFTFSFPCDQENLKNSKLITWTKMFRCTSGVGEDPCILLENAIEKIGGLPIPVNIMARISDTVGTLMAGNYLNKKCRIGLIIGTGSNACYMEKVENFEKLESKENVSEVCVCTEWGTFGDDGCLDFFRTEYEKEVDEFSPHKGSFTFEKSFSGLYLGELVRLVLLRLAETQCLFKDTDYTALHKKWSLETRYISDIEKDENTTYDNTRAVLKTFNLDATDEDVAVIRDVCGMLSQRAAYIPTAALSVLVEHINLPEVAVAVDGSLFEQHPRYQKCMEQLLKKLLPTHKVDLILAKDGSGQGAAYLAACN